MEFLGSWAMAGGFLQFLPYWNCGYNVYTQRERDFDWCILVHYIHACMIYIYIYAVYTSIIVWSDWRFDGELQLIDWRWDSLRSPNRWKGDWKGEAWGKESGSVKTLGMFRKQMLCLPGNPHKKFMKPSDHSNCPSKQWDEYGEEVWSGYMWIWVPKIIKNYITRSVQSPQLVWSYPQLATSSKPGREN